MNLTGYDWVVVSTSSGKDSSAMMDVVCQLAREQGVLERVVSVHADLGEEEWPGSKELAREHAEHFGVRFIVVKRAKGGILQHVLQRHDSLRKKGKQAPPWPSNSQRYCTSEHKRGPIATVFTRLARLSRAAQTESYRTKILSCLGMRSDESCARSKLPAFSTDRKNSNGRKQVDTWLPIFNWTLEEVWQRIDQSGLRVHPAYGLGMPRLSCVFCIYSPRNALILAGRHNPELLERYCAVEEKVGYTFQVKLGLKEVKQAIAQGEQPGVIRTWEM